MNERLTDQQEALQPLLEDLAKLDERYRTFARRMLMAMGVLAVALVASLAAFGMLLDDVADVNKRQEDLRGQRVKDVAASDRKVCRTSRGTLTHLANAKRRARRPTRILRDLIVAVSQGPVEAGNGGDRRALRVSAAALSRELRNWRRTEKRLRGKADALRCEALPSSRRFERAVP